MEAAMRKRSLAVAATILASLLIAPEARAFSTVVGGLAGACSRMAKSGQFDSHAIEICS
jgi:hypothetical protein